MTCTTDDPTEGSIETRDVKGVKKGSDYVAKWDETLLLCASPIILDETSSSGQAALQAKSHRKYAFVSLRIVVSLRV